MKKVTKENTVYICFTGRGVDIVKKEKERGLQALDNEKETEKNRQEETPESED